MASLAGRDLLAVTAPAVLGICAFLFGPKVDANHPASDLGTLFSSIASVLASMLIALAVLSVLPAVAALKVQRVVGWTTPMWLAVGVIAAVTGLVPDLHHNVYRVCFAASVCSGAWVLLAVLRIAHINLSEQRKSATDERAADLAAEN